MKELKRRISRLEGFMDSSRDPETLEEMLSAFERGEYGQPSVMALVASILSKGGSVEHLRGEYPDLLLDYFAERLSKAAAGADNPKLPLPADSPEKDRL